MDAFLKAVAQNHLSYVDQTVVIKFGGEIYDNRPALEDLLEQVRVLQIFGARVVLVHGGGTQINALCKQRHGFIDPKHPTDGEKLTSPKGLEAAYDALTEISKDIAARYNDICSAGRSGFYAETLPPYKDAIITAKQKYDGYYTGEISQINSLPIKLGLEQTPQRIFVMHSLCADEDKSNIYCILNVNADYVPCTLAHSLGAKRLILCTNEKGILDSDKKLIRNISPARIEALIADGTIYEGMIPKTRALVEAVQKGVEGAVILSPASLAKELFTRKGAGTLITLDGKNPNSTPKLSAA